MQPGFELRIRTMIKAMTDVVLPAVDPNNRAALDQARLVAGSLDMLIEQIDYAHWYEVADIKSLCALADELGALEALAGQARLRRCAQVAQTLAGRWDQPLSALRETCGELRSAIAEAIEAAFAQQDAPLRDAVERIVLQHSQAQIGRERAFVAKTRFDVYPDTLQALPQALAAQPG